GIKRHAQGGDRFRPVAGAIEIRRHAHATEAEGEGFGAGFAKLALRHLHLHGKAKRYLAAPPSDGLSGDRVRNDKNQYLSVEIIDLTLSGQVELRSGGQLDGPSTVNG